MRQENRLLIAAKAAKAQSLLESITMAPWYLKVIKIITHLPEVITLIQQIIKLIKESE